MLSFIYDTLLVSNNKEKLYEVVNEFDMESKVIKLTVTVRRSKVKSIGMIMKRMSSMLIRIT